MPGILDGMQEEDLGGKHDNLGDFRPKRTKSLNVVPIEVQRGNIGLIGKVCGANRSIENDHVTKLNSRPHLDFRFQRTAQSVSYRRARSETSET